ncbi:hypothetical protein P1P75_16695 [Streptomyces sp. ID05-39B]|uniref:hypothetical protein n=1 Tax=Streptomyces sp. ID05-39B TaxID=3028664 RepID=UPI0029A88061|nr:hypothetical protein [Streptomyces sp. ID05-39B]MDX3528029.1 hypothetical protein [Streptomyces sp. ID05-39B]
MTQSGQGEEPSARTAREGIVLPSDGGEPLLPGTTNGLGQDPYAGQQQYGGQQPPPPSGGPPAGGQTWGQPWGPEQRAGQQQGQSWPPPEDQRQWDGDRQWDTPQPTGPDAWRAAPQAGPGQGAGPLPPEGAPAPSSYGHGVPAAPLPPMEDSATRYIPPVPAHADEGATQYIPPVPAHADEGATQYLPPVPAPVDEGATQYIPPVAPGALPPESPAESTHFLGRAQQNAPGPQPGHGGQHGSHADAEATQYIPPVTGQSPYGAGERQPPAEFDNLFRSGGDDGPAGATQQMPRFSEPEPPAYGAHPAAHAQSAHAQPAYTPPGGGSGGRRAMRDDDHGGGRSGSRVPLFAAIGVALAVVGVGAGALLSSGGGADKGDDNKTVAVSAPATEDSASASTDAAEQQAVALDELLADSGSSRAAVISAVADVKKCDNLGKAAADLRDAAKQRTGLVTKLSGLTVDQLPDHAALTTALTKAWQASASADNHYAAWADQVAAEKGKLCKKGQARSTGQTQEANRASGTASAQKKKAAELWNVIAKTYGLTERQPVQL